MTALLCGVILCSCTQISDEIKMDKHKMLNNISVVPVNEKTDKTTEHTEKYEPVNYDDQKAIWFSYIDVAPLISGKNENEFKSNFEQVCKNIRSVGCNTIYIHVRPFGDALYNSELFQKSRYLSEKQNYDPLKIMIEIGHKYDLSVHGWINPLRCETEDRIKNISEDYQIKKWYDEISENDIICGVENDEHLWLNPAYEEVRSFIAEGVKEIVENYNVDGIHLDDYFYPTTDEKFDKQCYAENRTGDSIEKWRMNNISKMVSEIYKAVKSVNENILVGISPQGNIENNYQYMYADVKKWGSENGYCDYIVPQVYFGYNNNLKPFKETISDWNKIADNENIHLIIGLGIYKIMQEDEFNNTVGIIAQQINDSFEISDGVALYTYSNLFAPENSFEKRIDLEKTTIQKALAEN